MKNFLAVLRDRQFLVYVLVEALAWAGLFAYVSGSPMVFMDVFHVDKKTYGWIFAGLSVAFIGLSQFNGLLLRRFTSQQIVRVARPCWGPYRWGWARSLRLASVLSAMALRRR